MACNPPVVIIRRRPDTLPSDRVIECHVSFFGAAQTDGDSFDFFDELFFFRQQRGDGQSGADVDERLTVADRHLYPWKLLYEQRLHR